MKTNIEKSAEQISEYLHGNNQHVRVETITISDPPHYTADNVRAIRARMEVTQRVLALILEVSPRTVESWESGRTQPNGSSRRLLETLDKDSNIITL